MKKHLLLTALVILTSNLSTKAQDYYFYGYTDTLWTTVSNWDSYNGYPGTTIPANEYARIPSNFSLGRCSLDVDIVNNGRLLLQSKFYYNGHTVTNNNLMEFTGTIWGDLTNEPTGTLSLGWEPFFPIDNLSVNGSLTNEGLIVIDFNGDNNSRDYFQAVTTADLDGEIEIRFRNGFVPNLDTDYTIIYAQNNSVTGSFATEVWPANIVGEIVYEHNRVHVRFLEILPVELISFDATLKDHSTLLNWVTASEENNTGFEIQRSSDAVDWKTIDFVEGNGTTDLTNEYNYEDRNPLHGSNYYRLKQIDFDGKFEFSQIEEVTYQGKPNEYLKVFPNPATDIFSVMLFNPNRERVHVKIFSSTGQEVWQQEFKAGEMGDYWEKKFELPQEEMYFVMVQIGKVLETQKVTVIDRR